MLLPNRHKHRPDGAGRLLRTTSAAKATSNAAVDLQPDFTTLIMRWMRQCAPKRPDDAAGSSYSGTVGRAESADFDVEGDILMSQQRAHSALHGRMKRKTAALARRSIRLNVRSCVQMQAGGRSKERWRAPEMADPEPDRCTHGDAGLRDQYGEQGYKRYHPSGIGAKKTAPDNPLVLNLAWSLPAGEGSALALATAERAFRSASDNPNGHAGMDALRLSRAMSLRSLPLLQNQHPGAECHGSLSPGAGAEQNCIRPVPAQLDKFSGKRSRKPMGNTRPRCSAFCKVARRRASRYAAAA
jgi:hypothetical protein